MRQIYPWKADFSTITKINILEYVSVICVQNVNETDLQLSNPDIANNDKNTVSFNEVKITYRITGSIRHVGKENTKCNLHNQQWKKG